jgi:hypothetical protein
MQEKKAESTAGVAEKVDLGAQQAIQNVFGPSEAQQIHEESMQKISQMTEEQILEERRKLMASFNPETLDFFKKRGSSQRKVTPLTEELESLIPSPKSTVKNVFIKKNEQEIGN